MPYPDAYPTVLSGPDAARLSSTHMRLLEAKRAALTHYLEDRLFLDEVLQTGIISAEDLAQTLPCGPMHSILAATALIELGFADFVGENLVSTDSSARN